MDNLKVGKLKKVEGREEKQKGKDKGNEVVKVKSSVNLVELDPRAETRDARPERVEDSQKFRLAISRTNRLSSAYSWNLV